MSDARTLKVYASRAQDYIRLTHASNTKDPQLAAFIDALPAEAKVLDLGCGPGTSAGVMTRAGLRVTAWDPVPEMAAMAKRNAGVSVRQAGFDDLCATAEFDGIWANFSLLHAQRKDLPRHLKAIAHALRPGGFFHIGVKTGAGSERDALGRYYTYYSDADLTEALEMAGLHVRSRSTGNGTGLSGSVEPWICILSARG